MQHAKRLYPLLVSAKAQIEWGYNSATSGSDNEDMYVVVDKSVLDEACAGIEKLIGFEGVPDPATGFYCVRAYHRLKRNTPHITNAWSLSHMSAFL
jgi:hypothetical protein